MTKIERQIMPDNASLRQVLQRLNEGVAGIILMVQDNAAISGIFTDGDARRAILKAENLEMSASHFMNRVFTVAHETMPRVEMLTLLNDKIRFLPIVDDDNVPVDVLSWAEIWKLPLVEPSLGGNELKYVSECIKTNWISSQGSFVSKFESDFAKFHDVQHAIAVSSGTTALQLALSSMGIGKGDEVIVPNLTFGASANAVIHAGATPVFADICQSNWTIDPASIIRNITSSTKAIMPVHIYGLPADMNAIMDIANEYNLLVIEDCAESLGATFSGKLTGTFGTTSAFSFFANKTITTGEGGMVLTNDDKIANRMRLLRDHGMRKDKRYWHEEPGFNFRLTNMQSAVGCAQMERLDTFLLHRQKLGKVYDDYLSGLDFITVQEFGFDRKSSYWLYSICIDPICGYSRDEFIKELAKEGIESRPVFYPLDQQPAYIAFKRNECPVSYCISNIGVSLPTSNHMDIEEALRVCRSIKSILSRKSLSSSTS